MAYITKASLFILFVLMLSIRNKQYGLIWMA